MGENAPESEVGCVRLDGKGLEVLQGWGRRERQLECSEGLVCLAGPAELHAFSSEGGKWGSESRVVQDEFSVKISKAQK